MTIRDLVSGELLVLIDNYLLTIISHDEGVKEFSRLFPKGINSIYETSALMI